MLRTSCNAIFILYIVLLFIKKIHFRKDSAPVVNAGSTPSSQQYHIAPKPLMMEGEKWQGSSNDHIYVTVGLYFEYSLDKYLS